MSYMRKNHYSAQRNSATRRWQGWMTYADAPTAIVMTPDTYPTKREALAAIKAQHPQGR